MNTHKNNEKIIIALSEMEPIPDISADERIEREVKLKEQMEKATEEAPLAFARRISGVLCIALWGFSVFALLFGFLDLGAMIPFMLFSHGLFIGLNIPVFVKKGKIIDIIISVAATGICLMIAVAMLINPTPY